MAKIFADRVKELSKTTGLGAYELEGSDPSFQTFVDAIGSGNTVEYCATDGTNWEVGLGTVTSGTPSTLSRDTIYASSNNDQAVDWALGNKQVFGVISANKIDSYNSAIAALEAHAADTNNPHNVTADQVSITDSGGNYASGNVEDALSEAFTLFEPKLVHNTSATTDPTVNDDSSAGYTPLSNWFNNSTNEIFRCMDATVGAAVWVKTSLSINELGSMALEEASDYSLVTHNHDADYLGIDAKAVDSELLDGINSTQFLRSDVADTANGEITFATTTKFDDYLYRVTPNGNTAWLQQDGTGRVHWYWNTYGGVSPTFTNGGEDASSISMHTGNGGQIFFRSADGSSALANDPITWTTTLYVSLNQFTYKSNTIWHAGNDGAGSGLNADLLDGNEGSYYASNTALNTHTGDQNNPHNVTYSQVGADQAGTAAIEIATHEGLSDPHPQYLMKSNPEITDGYLNINPYSATQDDGSKFQSYYDGNARTWIVHGRDDLNNVVDIDITINGNKVWTEGNDGAGSGLNADTVDSLHSSSFLRSDLDDSGQHITLTGLTVSGSSTLTEILYSDSHTNRKSISYPLDQYLTVGEYLKIVEIAPSGSSQNYNITGKIYVQSTASVQIIDIECAIRSQTLPDLTWSAVYDEAFNNTGVKWTKPVLWVKETDPASVILIIEGLDGSVQNITAELEVVCRSNYSSNITWHTGGEQTTIDTGFTSYDFTLRNQNLSGYLWIGDNRDLQIGDGRSYLTGSGANATLSSVGNILIEADNDENTTGEALTLKAGINQLVIGSNGASTSDEITYNGNSVLHAGNMSFIDATFNTLTIGSNVVSTTTDIQLTDNANIASTQSLNFYIDSDNNQTDSIFGWYTDAGFKDGTEVELMTLTDEGVLTVTGAIRTSASDGIYSNLDNGYLRLSGGLAREGASIFLGGPTQASYPDEGILRVGLSNILTWNSSSITASQPLTYLGSQYNYWDTGSHTADFNNSDIIGLNGVYFNDVADTTSEGLMFPRGTGTGQGAYSNLRAYNDELLFAPDASGESFEVITSERFGIHKTLYDSHHEPGVFTQVTANDYIVLVDHDIFVTPFYDGTYISVNGALQVSSVASGSTQTISCLAGDVVSCSRPSFVRDSGGAHHSIHTVSAAGQQFGFRTSRNSPHNVYIYPLYGDTTVEWTQDTTDFTTPNTQACTGGQVTSFQISDDDLGHYYRFKSDKPILISKEGTGGDNIALYPASKEIVGRVGNTNEIESGTTITDTGVYFKYADGGITCDAIADGAGGDMDGHIPVSMLGDTYVIDHDVDGYILAANESCVVQVFNASGFYAEYDMTAATRNVPVKNDVGDVSGAGTSLGTGPWWFIGTAPFYLRTNDNSQDEYVVRGIRRKENGGYVSADPFPQYLGVSDKAADSELLDGKNWTDFQSPALTQSDSTLLAVPNSDWNDAVNTGFYGLSGGLNETPHKTHTWQYTITSKHNDLWNWQLATGYNDIDPLSYRKFDGGVWGDWIKVWDSNNLTATGVPITDSAGYYTSTNVEDALAEVWESATSTQSNYFQELRDTTVGINDTVPVHAWLANGAETDIDFAIIPKGNGAIVANIADGAIAGGNKRGNNAVDLQQKRATESSVASGTSAVLCGGYNNKAVGSHSVVCGGANNNANGSFSSIGGGYINLALGEYSTIPGGFQADTGYIYGKFAYASGMFNSYGDAQTGMQIIRNNTSDATPTILTSSGGTPTTNNVSYITANQSFAVSAIIIARDTTSSDTKLWKIEGAVTKEGTENSVAFVGTPTKRVVASSSGASGWGCNLVVNTTRGSVEVEVTGESSKTIHWVCKFDTVEVG